eukprot:TRINITY_DN99029_c0_g1_i1.p1 TRINITY_DN99029_c0_g1~~TRINITY_DN99029_c0_g1_i1.p1  ORF type:complete len:105 (+),score=19.04 TRINITY_DN99029_c0_g1_i1:85-399(+)
MTRSTSIRLVLSFIVVASAMASAHSEAATRLGADACNAEASSEKTDNYFEGWPFEGPLVQDLRLLFSFVMGIACVHTAEVLLGSGNNSEAMLRRKPFELYPFAL